MYFEECVEHPAMIRTMINFMEMKAFKKTLEDLSLFYFEQIKRMSNLFAVFKICHVKKKLLLNCKVNKEHL
jgi:hypothetical protein